ncbi:predicted protein [Lichtheimia corymbifera JMRC:FSU:9682]|uniref:Uncharacterized protein n=1 Tax=Lichtheimia corymbifera JMRC:FSU:9682 TaxID=1263082 RepID=A0A068RJ69_9FUNG|nr:hypothetical protein K492DRAFT_142998 [Lichtheimia hyalospora FSU 10163]CDH50223.1 predicted protein [Lichtheimia corymbifera JMRC:FSU:9682]
MPFTIVGEHGKKIPLEQQYHPCPRCEHPQSVQLMRSESHLVILNKHFGKTSNMRVRYECHQCGWKNENLPDNDTSTTPKTTNTWD